MHRSLGAGIRFALPLGLGAGFPHAVPRSGDSLRFSLEFGNRVPVLNSPWRGFASLSPWSWGRGVPLAVLRGRGFALLSSFGGMRVLAGSPQCIRETFGSPNRGLRPIKIQSGKFSCKQEICHLVFWHCSLPSRTLYHILGWEIIKRTKESYKNFVNLENSIDRMYFFAIIGNSNDY